MRKSLFTIIAVGALCVLCASCGAGVTVKPMRGTLEESLIEKKMPERVLKALSEMSDDDTTASPWLTDVVMGGTGVHVEALYQNLKPHDSKFIAAIVDPFLMQNAFLEHLGYSIEDDRITFYIDNQADTTVTNTVTDMGGFDEDAIWIGEQIRYDLSEDQPIVCITPGVKFITGLMLHYDDMPCYRARVAVEEDGTFTLSDLKSVP